MLPKVVQDTNVLEAHYSKNHHPRPPSPARLQHLQQHVVQQQQNPAVDDNEESDDSAQPSRRGRRYLKNARQEHCTDPTQLGLYPPKWMDFLDDCKVETRTYAVVHDPWPQRKAAIQSFILDVISMTVQKWRHMNQTVEQGYYPKYKQQICKLVCLLTRI